MNKNISNSAVNEPLMKALPYDSTGDQKSLLFMGILFTAPLIFMVPPVLMITAALIVCLIRVNKTAKKIAEEYKSSREESESNVKSLLKEKYGIELIEQSTKAFGGKLILKSYSLKAYNHIGQRIQVTLELNNKGKDVLAFSSGVEMPVLDRN